MTRKAKARWIRTIQVLLGIGCVTYSSVLLGGIVIGMAIGVELFIDWGDPNLMEQGN